MKIYHESAECESVTRLGVLKDEALCQGFVSPVIRYHVLTE